jgi:hypothetical protein
MIKISRCEVFESLEYIKCVTTWSCCFGPYVNGTATQLCACSWRENFFYNELLNAGDDMDAQPLEHDDGPVPLLCPYMMVLHFRILYHCILRSIMLWGQTRDKLSSKLCRTITVVSVRCSGIRDLSTGITWCCWLWKSAKNSKWSKNKVWSSSKISKDPST